MAETFKLGNTKWAVKEGSLLAYNDENENFKPLPFTFTRASTATRVNENGLIEVVKSGIPRIDYTDNPSGHLLLEPARTNLVTYSEAFTGYWATQSANVTAASGIIAPDGSENVISLNTTTTATFCGLNRVEATAFTNKTLSLSVFAKKITSDYIFFYNIGSVGGVTAIYFNINNGTLGTIGASWSNAKIEDYGDGWYRCSATVSYDAAGTDYIYIFQSDNNANPESTLGKQTYLYGSQLEEGSYATSYIPTSGTTVTRAAETCTGAGNAQVFNDSEGVLFAEMAALFDTSTYLQLSLSNDSASNRHALYYSADDLAYISINTTTVYITSKNNFSVLEFHKFALKYKANDFSAWFDGTKINSSNTGTPPSNLSVIDFDNGVGVFPFYGKIKQIGIYDTALTDIELENLTTETSEFDSINPAAFIMRVKTYNTGTSASNQFTIPTTGTGYNYTITTSDGQVIENNTGSTTITFSSAGTHDVRITGDFPRIYFNNGGDKSKLIDIKNWGDIAWTSMQNSFAGCNQLTDVSAEDVPNLSSTITLYGIFSNCTLITSVNLTNWDVSNIQDFRYALDSCPNLSVANITSWSLTSAIDVRFMFYNADSFDYSFANWDITSILYMDGFLQAATGLSTANYDATLISWAAQAPTSGISINFGGSKYTSGGSAEAARTSLQVTYGWTIVDGGPA